ncbi:helix-turn-helix domain-containing protein [Streptomyces zhihengii]
MAKPRPITDTDRAAVRRLHAEGKTRNHIARELKRSPATVSKLATELGLTFDRAGEVAVATENKRAQLADRRAQLALDFQHDAERLRAQLWEPCVYGEFGGKDNEWNQVDLSRPRFGDQRQIVASAAAAAQQSLRLAPAEGGTDADAVKSMLGALGEALTRAAGADDEQPADDDGGADGG